MTVKKIFSYSLLMFVSCNSTAMDHMHHDQGPTTLTPLDPMMLKKYLDPLPIPEVALPTRLVGKIPYYDMTMTQFKQKMHRQIPASTVWGYNGITPGPILLTNVGTPAVVSWINKLPKKHIFPLPDADMIPNPAVRTVTHLHGGMTPPQSDGYPDSWFVPGQNVKYTYPNRPEGFYTFYHDHAVGITALNVYAGLAGFYILKDPLEATLHLPHGKYSIPLMIQDKSFNTDGSLIFGSFYYNTAAVNGKVWPYLNVEPRKYRFRILNASTARILHLNLSQNVPIWQIGTDHGFLDESQSITDFDLAPAERVDLIIDFSDFNGQDIILENNFDPGGGLAVLTEIMQFRVNLPLTGTDHSSVPTSIRPYSPTKEYLETSVMHTRDLTLDGPLDANFLYLLNGKHWEDPVTENPALDSIEIWNLINLTPETHPIHLHLTRFRILDRTPINVEQYMLDKQADTLGPIESYFTGPSVQPANFESGWKDVVGVPEGQVTRIAMLFEGYPGRYVWHCHILDHEDYDMMRPMEVMPAC